MIESANSELQTDRVRAEIIKLWYKTSVRFFPSVSFSTYFFYGNEWRWYEPGTWAIYQNRKKMYIETVNLLDKAIN